MANRAYLYSSDRDGPDAWTSHGEVYYDSRWTIPLAWWFFFRARDVRLVEEGYGGERWHEVKLLADKDEALGAFDNRRELLMKIAGAQFDDGVISRFFTDVSDWPGKYLLADPWEIFAHVGDVDEGHHGRCLRILSGIDASAPAVENIVEAVSAYSTVHFESRDVFVGQVVGYTYS